MDARRVANLNGAQPQFTRVVNANEANTQRILATLDVNNKQSVQAMSRILQMSINDLISNTDRRNVRLVDLILGRTASLMDETVSRLSTGQLKALKADIVASIQQSSVGRLTVADKADIIKTITAYFDGKTNLAELKAGIAQLGILASDQNAKVADVKTTVVNSSQNILAGVNDAISRLNNSIAMSNFGALLKNQQILINSMIGISQQNAMTLAQLDAINTMNLSKQLMDWGIGQFFQDSFKMLGDWWRGDGEDSILNADIQRLKAKTDLDWTQDIVDNATVTIISKLDVIKLQLDNIANTVFASTVSDTTKYRRIVRPYKNNPDKPADGIIGWFTKPFQKLSDLVYSFVKGHDRMYDMPESYQTVLADQAETTRDAMEEVLEKIGVPSFIAGSKAQTKLLETIKAQLLNKKLNAEQQSIRDNLNELAENARKNQKARAESMTRQTTDLSTAFNVKHAERAKQNQEATKSKKRKQKISRPQYTESDNNWFGKRSWTQSFKNFFKTIGNICEWLGTENGGYKFWEHMKVPGLPSLVENLSATLSNGLDLGKSVDKIVDALITPDKNGKMPLVGLIGEMTKGGKSGGMFSGIASKIIDQALTPEKIGIISNTIITEDNVKKISCWLFEGENPFAKQIIANFANSKDSSSSSSFLTNKHKKALASKFIDRIINPQEGEDFVGLILKAVLKNDNFISNCIDAIDKTSLSPIVNSMFDGKKSDISISDDQKQKLTNKFVDAFVNGDTFISTIIDKCLNHETLFNDVVNILVKPKTDEKGGEAPSLLATIVSKIVDNIDFESKSDSEVNVDPKIKSNFYNSVLNVLSDPKNIMTITSKLLNLSNKIVDALCKETTVNGVSSSPIERILMSAIPSIATNTSSSDTSSSSNKISDILIGSIFTPTNCAKLADAIFKDTTINRVIDVMFEKDKNGKSPIQKMIDNFIDPSKLVADPLQAKAMGEDQLNQQDDGFKTKIIDAVVKRIETVDLNQAISQVIFKTFDSSTTAKTNDGKTISFAQYLIDRVMTSIETSKDAGSSKITDAFVGVIDKLNINSTATYFIDKCLDAKYDDTRTIASRIADEFIAKINSSTSTGTINISELMNFKSSDGKTSLIEHVIDKVTDPLKDKIIKSLDEKPKEGEKSFVDRIFDHLSTTTVKLPDGQTTTILASLAALTINRLFDKEFVSSIVSTMLDKNSTDNRDMVSRFFDLTVDTDIKFSGLLPNIKTKTMATKILDTFLQKLEPLKPGLIFANALKEALKSSPPKFEIDASVMSATEFRTEIAKKISEQLAGETNTEDFKNSVAAIQTASKTLNKDVNKIVAALNDPKGVFVAPTGGSTDKTSPSVASDPARGTETK